VKAVIPGSGISDDIGRCIRKQFALLMHCVDAFEGLTMHVAVVDSSKDIKNDLLF
jgi:hypothetical protein